MKIGENKEIDVEAYYARYGPMLLRRCRRLLRDNEKDKRRGQASKKKAFTLYNTKRR
ncbi:hypothetical protein ACFLRT_03285 [Acidobacteriota bacterium]